MKKATTAAGGWLFKEEPNHYSYNDLERDGSTNWDGVTNNQARLNLRRVRLGDRVLYYHTGQERAIVGEMRVVQGPGADPSDSDPKAVVVKVQAVRRWPTSVTLEQIKADPAFAAWDLVKNSRLSVMAVSPDLLRRLEQLGGA